MSVSIQQLNELADLGAPAEREGFQITDLGGATWAMRKLVSIRRQEAAIEAAAEAEIRRIREWELAEAKRLDGPSQYFEALLTGYHVRRLAEDERAKTIKLPHGSLKCRAQQPEFIRNEDELLAWAEATDPELVEVKKSPRWAEIKKHGEIQGEHLVDPITGEIVAGVMVIQREPKFTVDIDPEVLA